MKFLYKPIKKFFYAIIVILVALVIYLCGMVFTEQNYEWYLNLNKPLLQPPSWVFMLVWAILFLFIAISAILVLFESKSKNKTCSFAIVFFIINALFNTLFNILFFGLHSMLLALILMPFFLASTFILIWCVYKINKVAAYLLIPYVIWAVYATVLMVNVYFIN